MKINSSEISDTQFWEILKQSAGIYSVAASIIKDEFSIEYTRSMVKERAELQPERIKQIQDEYLDSLEDILFLSVFSQRSTELLQIKDSDLIKKVYIHVRTRAENLGMTLDEITAKLVARNPYITK